MNQRKVSKNLGKDTHTRDFSQNIFKSQNHETFQLLAGEVQIPQSEPLFNQNMVTVKMARGGRITDVAYPGAFIEPISGNLHGTYEGPIPGQMVMVGFENGNMNSPMVVNRFPYQGSGNSLTSIGYKLPLTKSFYNSTDVVIGHFSGSFLSFNTGAPIAANGIPGSVKLYATTDVLIQSNINFNAKSLVSAEINSTLVTLTGSTAVALNGNTNFAVKYLELKTAFDQLKTDFNNLVTLYNSHIHITTATVGPTAVPGIISPTVSTGTPSAADMSLSKNDKVLM